MYMYQELLGTCTATVPLIKPFPVFIAVAVFLNSLLILDLRREEEFTTEYSSVPCANSFNLLEIDLYPGISDRYLASCSPGGSC